MTNSQIWNTLSVFVSIMILAVIVVNPHKLFPDPLVLAAIGTATTLISGAGRSFLTRNSGNAGYGINTGPDAKAVTVEPAGIEHAGGEE